MQNFCKICDKAHLLLLDLKDSGLTSWLKKPLVLGIQVLPVGSGDSLGEFVGALIFCVGDDTPSLVSPLVWTFDLIVVSLLKVPVGVWCVAGVVAGACGTLVDKAGDTVCMGAASRPDLEDCNNIL